MFSMCSEFFSAIPFYALVPRLNCHIQKEDGTWEILEGCPKGLACNLPKEEDFYTIDWNDGKSLQNWMTDLNLICEPAYRIGLIGSLQFIGLALGALIFTPFSDIYGRKPVLVFSVVLTPIVIFSLIIFTSTLNHIYFWITLLSLSFSSRCSASFMMGQEYLRKEMAIYFSAAIFVADGSMSIFCAVVMATTRSQNVFILFIAIVIAVFWILVYLYCPETPKYLYEKKQYRELEKALLHIAHWNGKNVEAEIRYEIKKLKRAAAQVDVSIIVEKPQNRM
jgi:MFS family permease